MAKKVAPKKARKKSKATEPELRFGNRILEKMLTDSDRRILEFYFTGEAPPGFPKIRGRKINLPEIRKLYRWGEQLNRNGQSNIDSIGLNSLRNLLIRAKAWKEENIPPDQRKPPGSRRNKPPGGGPGGGGPDQPPPSPGFPGFGGDPGDPGFGDFPGFGGFPGLGGWSPGTFAPYPDLSNQLPYLPMVGRVHPYTPWNPAQTPNDLRFIQNQELINQGFAQHAQNPMQGRNLFPEVNPNFAGFPGGPVPFPDVPGGGGGDGGGGNGGGGPEERAAMGPPPDKGGGPPVMPPNLPPGGFDIPGGQPPLAFGGSIPQAGGGGLPPEMLQMLMGLLGGGGGQQGGGGFSL